MGDEQQRPPDLADRTSLTASKGPAEHAHGTEAGQSAGETPGEKIGGSNDGQKEAAGDGTEVSARTSAQSNATADKACDSGLGKDCDPGIREEGGQSEQAEQTERIVPLSEIEFHVTRAIRYHEARARFLDFWRRTFDFLVVVLGAGAVSAAAGEGTFWSTVIGIALAAIGALQLVAGFSEKAGEHAALKRRFCSVLAEIMEARGEPDHGARRLQKITKKWTAIWTDEPPTMHVLEAIAFNAACRTLTHDLDETTLIEIGWWQGLTRNLSSWESFEALSRRERADRREAKAQSAAKR